MASPSLSLLLRNVSLVLLLILPMKAVFGHSRLECPPPRSGYTAEKMGPCDVANDDPVALPAYPLQPGLNTITWLESIGHPGAAQRFALSLDGSDKGFESCILLDHVPHDEHSQPNYGDETSYHRMSITLFIPNVKCDRCHLQLISVMSDNFHGLPEGDSCVYAGAKAGSPELAVCKAVYHSCAPVSITGTVPRDQYTCSLPEFQQELDWPVLSSSSSTKTSTYAFKANPGLFDRDNARLLSFGLPVEKCASPFYCEPSQYYQEDITVPSGAKYATPQGSCAAITNTIVESFELGKLPTVFKENSDNNDSNSDNNINDVSNKDKNSTDLSNEDKTVTDVGNEDKSNDVSSKDKNSTDVNNKDNYTAGGNDEDITSGGTKEDMTSGSNILPYTFVKTSVIVLAGSSVVALWLAI